MAALHSKMEEEYHLASSSLEKERGRLENMVRDLEGELQDERHAQAARCSR